MPSRRPPRSRSEGCVSDGERARPSSRRARARRPLCRRRALCSRATRACETTTKYRSRRSTCSSSSPRRRARTARGCSGGGFGGSVLALATRTADAEELAVRVAARTASERDATARISSPLRLPALACAGDAQAVRERVARLEQAVALGRVRAAARGAEAALRVVEAEERPRARGTRSFVCRAAYRSAAVKWLAREADRRPAAHLSPKPRLVGQRQPAGVGVMAVLLREDVRHVLLGDGALEAADDRRGEPVGVALPRAAPVPRRRARGRARRASPTPMRGTSRRPRASSTTFSTTQLAGGEQPVAVTVRDEPWRRCARRSTARPSTRAELEDELEPVEAELEPARQDAAAPAPAPGAGRRCRWGRARAEGCGPSTRTLRPPSAELAPARRVSRSTTRADRAGLEHAVGARAARPRPDARRRRRRRQRSCCQATSCPAGAQSVASRRKKRNVTKRSPSAARQVERDVERLARRRRAAPAAGRAAPASPSTVSSHSPR